MDIKVKVNAEGRPVIYHSQGKGPSKINWKLNAEGYRFKGVEGLDDFPFSELEVTDKKISVMNTNRGTKTIDYDYCIIIEPETNPPGQRKKRSSRKAVIRNEP